MSSRPPFHLGFRLTIALVLASTVLAMALVTVVLTVAVGADATKKNAAILFSRIVQSVEERIDDFVAGSLEQARSAAQDPDALLPIEGSGRFHPFFGVLKGILVSHPSLRSVSLGATDGSLLQLVRVERSPELAARLKAPADTRFLLRIITPGTHRTQTWTFLGAAQTPLGQVSDSKIDFSAETALWVQQAIKASTVVVSNPFPSETDKKSSVAISVAFPGGQRVLGMELTLGGLQTYVDRQVISAHGGLEVLDGEGKVLAQSQGFEDRPDWFKTAVDHRIAFRDYRVVLTAPRADFGGEFRLLELIVIGATILLLVLLVPLTLSFTGRLTRIITVLGKDVEKVCQMDFSGDSPQSSKIREFDQLARGFAIMKLTLSGETKVLADAQLKLKKIVETGIALSTEKDSNALCQKILDTAKELTDADGGTLYLLNPKERILDFNIMLNDTLGTRFGGTSGIPIPAGLKVKLYRDDGEENHHNVASHAFLTGETFNITDAYDNDQFDFSGTRKFDEANGYRSKSFLTVPLKPLGGDVLGVLQLINARQKGYFTNDMEEFVKALSASAATALYNKQLLDDLEQLFDAIIDIINGAIGRKSPYTGGHCERVPIIATELAKVTSAVQSGPLAGFSLDTKALREFVLAAKLHDVGKVTTPEYVVDKSTKLETIYNRIHEVRTRFEVLYRDAIIRRHEAVLADKTKAKAADKELAEFKKVLDDEWEFLAKANLGGEYLPPEQVERIKAIGSRTWLRYFDDRLGLSWEEEFRLAFVEGLGTAKPTLPAPETLLADKPIHVFPRQIPFETAYQQPDKSPYPFKTPVPKALYNQGEIYNLAIGRGTLTEEEHFKIKEHVMQSIYMLDRLPWPKGLEMVPVIAGEHHETLVGTGYPYQRRAEDLSMQSRILTVADIFEALTASDRPYKKPKMLSEAVKILYFFKKDRHIDADLFDLFLTSGIYLEYAKVYLRPDQIDEVNITPYLGPIAS